MHCCRWARGCALAQQTGRLAAAGPMAAAAPRQKTLKALHRTAQLTAAPCPRHPLHLLPKHRPATQQRRRRLMAPQDRRRHPPTLQRMGSCRRRMQAGCAGRWLPFCGLTAAAGSRQQQTRRSVSRQRPLRAELQGEICGTSAAWPVYTQAPYFGLSPLICCLGQVLGLVESMVEER